MPRKSKPVHFVGVRPPATHVSPVSPASVLVPSARVSVVISGLVWLAPAAQAFVAFAQAQANGLLTAHLAMFRKLLLPMAAKWESQQFSCLSLHVQGAATSA